MDLSDRELAAVIWTVLFALWAVTLSGVRSALATAIRVAVTGPILLAYAVFLAWNALAIALAARIGLWNPSLVKETVVWIVLSTPFLFLQSVRLRSEPDLLRRLLAEAVGASVFLTAYINLVSLPFIAELALVPIVSILALTSLYRSTDPAYQPARTFARRMLVAIGLGLVAATTVWLASGSRTLNVEQQLLSTALPIGMTTWTLPFVYLFAVAMAYETVAMSVRGRGRAPRRNVLALAVSTHVDLAAVASFSGVWLDRLAAAHGFRASRLVAREHRQSLTSSRGTRLGRIGGWIADRFHERTSPRRTPAEIADSLLTTPRRPNRLAQEAIAAELDRMLDRAANSRRSTDTKAAALLAALVIFAGTIARGVDASGLDSNPEIVAAVFLIGSVTVSLGAIFLVFWASQYSIGWAPEEMTRTSSDDATDVRQHIIVNLAGATVYAMEESTRKGSRFNMALVFALIGLACAIYLGVSGGLVWHP